MSEKKFQRTTENFTCENCGHTVQGTGYTNHCPQCLWSKHVDVNPGDRQAICRGMMEPVGLDRKNGEDVIVHRCMNCGVEKRNKKAPDDNFDAVLSLIPTTVLK